MNQLRCSVTSCANNADNCCCRPEIKVGGHSANEKCETKCSSFISKTCGATNCVCNSTTNPSLCISCSVSECEYHDRGKCVAPSVDIDGQGATTMSETQCSTFKKKSQY